MTKKKPAVVWSYFVVREIAACGHQVEAFEVAAGSVSDIVLFDLG